MIWYVPLIDTIIQYFDSDRAGTHSRVVRLWPHAPNFGPINTVLSSPWQQTQSVIFMSNVYNDQMAISSTLILSNYAEELSVFDKGRYLQNTRDPYCYQLHTVHCDVLLLVRSTDISNYLVLSTSFCTGKCF